MGREHRGRHRRPSVGGEQTRRDAALRELLEGDLRVRDAAIIGRTFRLDPVTVLGERDRFARLVRVAAANIIIREERPGPSSTP